MTRSPGTPNPVTMLIAAAVSGLICVVLLGMTWGRIIHPRSTDAGLVWLRYGQMGLFAVGLMFWCWSGWQSWARYHAASAGSGKVV